MNRIYILGAGPGDKEYILPAAVEKMKEAHAVIGAKRLLPVLMELTGQKNKFYPFGKIEEMLDIAGELLKEGDVAVAVSGDPLLYSFLKTIKDRRPGWDISIVPGIGSLQMLGAVFGQTMEDAAIISVHGRKKTRGAIALSVKEHEKSFFLCSKEQGPAWLSEIMVDYGLLDVTVYAGADLSYESQFLASGSPEEMAKKEFPGLCVAMIKNPSPAQVERKAFLKDRDFARGKTPMTKEEIRAIIMMKLCLTPDSVVWDIGAGTGSVSIECARQCPYGEVHAVERSAGAVRLIEENKSMFGTKQLFIYQGQAMEVIPRLPVPDAVFIGGSGGELCDILFYIANLDMKIRIVITAVTVETIAQCSNCLKELGRDYEITQVTVGRGRKIGSYHIVDTNNPVMIFEAVI